MRAIGLGLVAATFGLGAGAHAQDFVKWSDGYAPSRLGATVQLADEPGPPPRRPVPRRAAPPPQEPPPQPPPVVTQEPPRLPPPALMRWYMVLSAGALIPKTTDFQAGGFVGQIDWGVGFSVFAGIGYRLTEYFAVELEGAYLYIPVDGVNISATSASVDGTSHHVGLFGNIVYRHWPYWYLFNNIAIAPYIGGGVGFVHRFDTSFSATVNGTTVTGDFGRTHLAAQAKVGVDFRVTENISVAPEYRFLWVVARKSVGHSYIHSVGASLKFHF
jgi:opacity protein-like surface antigen